MKVAFIGSTGIPNRYGGFESFLESVGPVLVSKNVDVTVTCDLTKHPDGVGDFHGVKRVFLNIKANGILSPIHDLLAFLKVFNKVDAIVVLGVSAGPFFLLMRLICDLTKKKLLINVDGVEWRRDKFGFFAKCVLWIFDALSQIAAHKIIYDNAALEIYIYPIFRHKSTLIPYSGDQVIRKFEIEKINGSALTICRVEPENNLELMIQAALDANLNNYTIIGNWNNSVYGSNLRNKYIKYPNLHLLDPIYDSGLISEFRESCDVYLHGHSVGGTNPSLVEMLFYDCDIYCFDCSFNRATATVDVYYFSSASDLSKQLRSKTSSVFIKKERKNLQKYQAKTIAENYIDAISAS